MNENTNFEHKLTKIKILKISDLPKIPLLQSNDIPNNKIKTIFAKRNINNIRKLKNILKFKPAKSKDECKDDQRMNLNLLLKNKSYNYQVNKSLAQIAKEIAEKNMSLYLSNYYDIFKRPIPNNTGDDESEIDNYNIKNDDSEDENFEEKEDENEEKKLISERAAQKLKKLKSLKRNFSQNFITVRNKILKDEEKIKHYQKILMKNRLNKVEVKINKENMSYSDPLSSYNAVSQNKLICKNILKNYKGTMISQYAKTIEQLNPIIKILNNNKKPNIKIFPSITQSMGINDKQDYFGNESEIMIDNENDSLNQSSIGKKLHKKLFDKSLLYKRNRLYVLKNNYQYPNKNFPGSLSEFTITQGPSEIILFGGNNSDKNPIIWKFNNDDISWEIIKPEDTDNIYSRYGHTSVIKNGNLYVYGGVYLENKKFANLDIFNFSTKKWSSPIFNTKYIIDLRKNHVSCSIGNMMFIHGGINEQDEYLNDNYLLNYQPLQWKTILLKRATKIPSLAYHSCCLVVPKQLREDPNFSIYKDLSDEKLKNSNIKEMGIYIFGGKLSEYGGLNPNLYVLKIGARILEWVVLKTLGAPPKKRFGATMSYYELGNILIIHGGRNNAKVNYAFSDTFILDLFSLNWLQVEYFDKSLKVTKRFFHQSFIDNNSFYVFGGTNETNYLGSEMFILELDSHKKCLKKREEYNISKIMKKSITENKSIEHQK